MLPNIDLPGMQRIVDRSVEGGVKDVIIVTGPTKRAIEDHFDRSIEFETELRAKGKHEEADSIKAIAELANFIYIRQKGEIKGNAIPVVNSEHIIGNEPFMYFFADDFFTGEVSYAKQMVEAYQKTGKSVLCLREVSDEDTSRYGVVGIKEDFGDGLFKIDGYYEKPGPENAPSRYACVCGYLLTPNIMSFIDTQTPTERGEIEMASAIDLLARNDDVYGLVIKGDYHDTGSPELYVQTLLDIALQDDTYGHTLREYLRNKL